MYAIFRVIVRREIEFWACCRDLIEFSGTIKVYAKDKNGSIVLGSSGNTRSY